MIETITSDFSFFNCDINQYELNVVSENTGKIYNNIKINNETFIGIEKNDCFKMIFKNKSYFSNVYVAILVDGLNILTGKFNDTTGKKFYVWAGTNLELEGWPEHDGKGSKFVFTSKNNSVVANYKTRNSSQIGNITAVVFQDKTHNTFEPFYPDPYPWNPVPWVPNNDPWIKWDVICANNSNTINASSIGVGAGYIVEQNFAENNSDFNLIETAKLNIKYLPFDDLIKNMQFADDNEIIDIKPKYLDLSGVPKHKENIEAEKT